MSYPLTSLNVTATICRVPILVTAQGGTSGAWKPSLRVAPIFFKPKAAASNQTKAEKQFTSSFEKKFECLKILQFFSHGGAIFLFLAKNAKNRWTLQFWFSQNKLQLAAV